MHALSGSNAILSGWSIGGVAVGTARAERFAVTDPASGETVATLARMGATEARRAVDAAAAALPLWSRMPAIDRADILQRWHREIIDHREALAITLTREQGKPLAEARAEIDYAAGFVRFYAEEARRIYGEIIPSHRSDLRLTVLREPIGVVACITPWNFPGAMVTRKLAPALAAGCTVVLKPSELTPLTAVSLVAMAERAGLPPGAVNVIGGDAPAIGRAWCEDPRVRGLSFTGSTAVGITLFRQCAATVKRVGLELGGNAPFLVFDDADLDAAVEGALVSKFRNAGQTCVCTNRFLVQDGIHDAFVDRLAARVEAMVPGHGMDERVTIGPLIDARAVAKADRLVTDAVANGAALCVGGGAEASLGERFFRPTVMTGVTTAMAIAREEIFAPVAAVFRFRDEGDAIALANDTETGLASYLYTRDAARIVRVSEALDFGMVGINTGMISTEAAPFGGRKLSGLGREGSRHGLDEFLDYKYLCQGGIA